MANIQVTEAQLETAAAAPAGVVDVADVEVATGGTTAAVVEVADVVFLIGGSVATIPYWRINQDTQEWVPIGPVYGIKSGKWVQL